MLYLTEKENYDLSVINFQSESGFYFFSALIRGGGSRASGAGEGLLFVCAARGRGSCLLSSVTYFLYILTFYCKFLDLWQILLINQ